MINLTFPDGAQRSFAEGTTGLDIAKGISPSLAKRTVAMALDGVVTDLADPIERDARIEFVNRDDPRALELIRHDCAHVLAEAVQELFPGTQVTIGPVIENGFYYDFARNEPFTLEDLPKIEAKMREIIARDKPFTKDVWSRDKAKDVFREKGEAYKVELVDAIPEGQSLKIYHQGDWFDLCRGPHMTSTGKIGNAFKLMKVAGAYWRGDSNNPMLTRIYGTAWKNQEDLDLYLHQLEEAEKRDHRRLGREMDLFHFQEEGPGVVFWHPKGWSLFQSLIAYMRRRLAADYAEVNAPQVLDKSLWETSGHWGWYKENMFKVQSAGDETEDERIFALKPMNCPGHVQIFKHGLKSYRDLPMRLAEFGAVHRYEPSGALHGLMRVRGFTQDDAHIFCTEEQMAEECLKINDLILSTYADFGFEEIVVKLSTRPEKRVGTDEVWDHAEAVMSRVLEEIAARSGGRIKTDILPGEGAFYGPKFEYTLRDAIGREWQCGTTQVDFNLPERFGAFYVDADGTKKPPVMIHRAICGSMERFTGILIEHFAGHFPLWLAPSQVVVATITSDADPYAEDVVATLKAAGLRAETDLRNEKITYKVREHSLAKVPVLLVVGRKEAAERTVSVRRLGSPNQTSMTLDEALAGLLAEATPPDLAQQNAARAAKH
ncbi:MULTISPECIES: threonine--tRNA ligase [unclassified Chelatococcus]|uniref:threonine--tRNA ligase n=1 Tax=unclassified Chelatococcus TaxID=2638111 RepID=UPI001BCD0E45|nr:MULTISPECIES: threonine--tRNA ligase [unclassified Chelatococcus]CAH1668720.1 threonine--tRNA ligase [Hyphomicrobiales bacterium]MBS7738112.1 threonine--tRNA ligase [Chelatococcus sp. HY11]MBX3546941.1 threonine--tRNA ligase [Chelatococcus sp.]MCO5077542.1 threonine--tRNA ligase [Chelatococcus sp.]CAH1679059.1 threonine--tRNA ligase [Hyphomicrobiales bacterium]